MRVVGNVFQPEISRRHLFSGHVHDLSTQHQRLDEQLLSPSSCLNEVVRYPT